MVLPHNAIEEQLLELYGISLLHPEQSHPAFGSFFQTDLRDGLCGFLRDVTSDEEGHLSSTYEPQTKMTAPTLRQLCYHFGFMQSLQDVTTDFIRRSRGTLAGRDIPSSIITALENQAERRFISKVVQPARINLHLIEYPCYLYCTPSLSEEIDYLTGKPIYRKGTYVLTLLPKTKLVALHYGLDEAEIAVLARQVVWVIRHYLCAHGVIHGPEQLIAALDGWLAHLDTLSRYALFRDIEEHHPHLIGLVSKQVLLPPS